MSISEKIENWAGEKIASFDYSGGGSIAQAQIITMLSGKKYFLKSGVRSKEMFPTEANSLKELAKAKTIRTPVVHIADPEFLLIEYISSARNSNSFFEDFGIQLAEMHRYEADIYGFYEDNFIGHTPQLNLANKEQAENWTSFYFEKRLLFQFKLAEKQGHSSDVLRSSFKKIEAKINDILDTDDAKPSLLHGDLWSGNYIADEKGNPVIIDPAVYYGHREADLAMTKVFGGFPSSFYDSYNEGYPFADGYLQREDIYKLYHILNHLNLFGMGYHGQAVSLMQGYL